MAYSKTVLAKLEGCYSVSELNLPGGACYVFASEARGGAYVGIEKKSLAVSLSRSGLGGTMQMEQIPEMNSSFLSVFDFFPVFRAENAKLSVVRVDTNGSLDVTPYLDMPFLHRFSLTGEAEKRYLLLSTVCGEKKDTDDWSRPGAVLAGLITFGKDGLPSQPQLRQVLSGIHRNHGLCATNLDGKRTILVAADEGVFALRLPENPADEWEALHLIQSAAGEAIAVDIDQDGADEIVTISPFHGTDLTVYRKAPGGSYVPMYQEAGSLSFGHGLWGGVFNRIPAVICSYRSGERAIFMLVWRNGRFHREVIDTGIGISNFIVSRRDGQDVIIAADNANGQALMYTLSL